MPSVRAQIFAYRDLRLQEVVAALSMKTFLLNPREPLGADQFDGIAVMDGGDREPASLTGGVADMELEFSVAWFVAESDDATIEEKLDAAFVEISDKLLDPDKIQMGGLAIDIRRLGMSEPKIGRPERGSMYLAAQSMDFAVRYFEREGDASSVGP